eukprot:5483028-Amphidinium_carterae.1
MPEGGEGVGHCCCCCRRLAATGLTYPEDRFSLKRLEARCQDLSQSPRRDIHQCQGMVIDLVRKRPVIDQVLNSLQHERVLPAVDGA